MVGHYEGVLRDGFPTPEAAALASYSAAAQARVARVERLSDDRVDVIIDTEPSHPMRVHCRLVDGAWHDFGDIVE
jgi:hypothetical protein